MNTSKLLTLAAIILTIFAVGVWVVYFSQNNTVANTLDNSTESPTGSDFESENKPVQLQTSENFNLVFSTEEQSSKLNEDFTVDVLLEGDTFNITSSELVIYYDTQFLEFKELVQGDLFDLYTQESVDTETGIIRFAGSLTSELVKTSGNFASLKFSRIAEGETAIQIVSSGDNNVFSKVVGSNIQEYAIQGDILNIK